MTTSIVTATRPASHWRTAAAKRQTTEVTAKRVDDTVVVRAASILPVGDFGLSSCLHDPASGRNSRAVQLQTARQ